MSNELAIRRDDWPIRSSRELRDQAISSRGLGARVLHTRWCNRLTPGRLVTQLRLAQIKAELANGDKKIKDVAWQFRFCDYRYFCEWFKDLMNVTPGKYRLQVRDKRKKERSGRGKDSGTGKVLFCRPAGSTDRPAYTTGGLAPDEAQDGSNSEVRDLMSSTSCHTEGNLGCCSALSAGLPSPQRKEERK